MENSQGLEPDELANMVSYQVRLIQIAAYKHFESQTRNFGLAPRYYGLLRIIQGNPGTNQSRLAEAVCLDRSSLVPILNALTKEGVILRRPSENDRRVRCVFLTKKGEALLNEIEERVNAHERHLVKALTKNEKDTLVGLLRRISESIRVEEFSDKILSKAS